MVKKLWELVHVLREHAVPVELVTATDPGSICYSDQFQIAAIPRRRSRQRR